MDMRFPFSPAEVAKVRMVQFGILSPDEIRQMSVVHIEHVLCVAFALIAPKSLLMRRNPKNRLKKILDSYKSKTKCDGGDDIESQSQDTDEPVKKSRGGCGAQQPKITIEGYENDC
ncbi:hypothetical protein POM88_013432 [Heracleum sosnowskyi]|uniref:DNA-directed RNA polymerase n=1 Tax=Heracleum sosnowskyi TaxID=360622 RepID=A0AAD8J113_9APIA|nr:hypothetical protein POM88_013432 [Heracleum sosnowskyi]